MRRSSKTLRLIIILALATGYAALVAILAMPLLGRYQPPKELQLDKAGIHHGVTGTPLTLTLDGTGFDENTRFSLVLDSGNQQAIINRIETFGPVDSILRNGRTLYLGIREQRINQYDLNDPDRPILQQTIPLGGKPISLARQREKLWIATGFGSLNSYDISKNSITTDAIDSIISQLDTDEDGIIYVAASRQGLLIFRPQPDYAGLKPLGALKLPGKVLNVLVSGRLAFVGGIQTGLYICDISNLSAPKVLASLPTPGIIQDIALRKNLLLLATTEGMAAVDITHPAKPSVISRLSMGKFYEVLIEGNQALLAAGAGGLLTVDITDPKQLQITGHLTPGDSIRCLAVKDTRAYLGTESNGLLVVDLNRLHRHSAWRPTLNTLNNFAVPVEPVERRFQLPDDQVTTLLTTARNQLPADCSLNELVHDNTTAYFCTRCGLAVAPLNDPTKFNLLQQPLAYTSRIWISGTTAYVAGAQKTVSPYNLHKSLKASSAGLQIFDLGVPLKPRVQGFIETGHAVSHFLIDHHRGYLAIKEQGVMIVDLHNPEHPQLLGMAKLPWPEQHFAGYDQLYLKDHILYVACGRAGLQIFDVSDPQEPKRIAATNTPGGWIVRLAGKGDQLFVQNFNNDLQLYDISNARSPRLTGTLDRFAGIQTMDIHDEKLRISFYNNLQIERALPLVAQHTDIASNTRVELTFPPPVFAGDYRLYAFNQRGRRELPGVISIEKGQK